MGAASVCDKRPQSTKPNKKGHRGAAETESCMGGKYAATPEDKIIKNWEDQNHLKRCWGTLPFLIFSSGGFRNLHALPEIRYTSISNLRYASISNFKHNYL